MLGAMEPYVGDVVIYIMYDVAGVCIHCKVVGGWLWLCGLQVVAIVSCALSVADVS